MFSIVIIKCFVAFLVLVKEVLSAGYYSDEKHYFGKCETSEYKGVCVPAVQCGNLYRLIYNARSSQYDRKRLTDSQCGFNNNPDITSYTRKLLLCCELMDVLPIDDDDDAPKIDNSQCGVAQKAVLSQYIVGGQKTSITSFPWMALIEYNDVKDSSRTAYRCSGSLINNRYILTAGHCVHDNSDTKWMPYRVHLGDWDHTNQLGCDVENNPECSSRSVNIEMIHIHPEYPTKHYHDIALIRLSETVQFTEFIRPICLPSKELQGLDLTDALTEMANWGQKQNGEISEFTDQKFKISLKVWNTKKCSRRYRMMNNGINPEYEICAGGEQGVDACHGDSGGPLMFWTIENKIKVYQAIAVLSYGPDPCGIKGYPSVNIKVDSHMKWIRHIIKS